MAGGDAARKPSIGRSGGMRSSGGAGGPGFGLNVRPGTKSALLGRGERKAMVDDAQLLRQYVEEGSQKAFSELVDRHLGLVYQSALRQVGGNEALAQDVAQGVFLTLGRKARDLLS